MVVGFLLLFYPGIGSYVLLKQRLKTPAYCYKPIGAAPWEAGGVGVRLH